LPPPLEPRHRLGNVYVLLGCQCPRQSVKWATCLWHGWMATKPNWSTVT